MRREGECAQKGAQAMSESEEARALTAKRRRDPDYLMEMYAMESLVRYADTLGLYQTLTWVIIGDRRHIVGTLDD
jgi:hypothetical protein